MNKAGFSQPSCMEDLLDEMQNMTEASRIIAGGTDIMVDIYKKSHIADCYISLSKVQELNVIKEEKDSLYLGSMLTHDVIAHDCFINHEFYALAEAAASIGSQQIRNRGTIGGNLVNASLAGDAIICLFLYGALIEIMDSTGNLRRIPVSEFILKARKTALKTGEIVKGIVLPRPKEHSYSVFHKIGTRSKVTVAKISIALSMRKEPDKLPDDFKAFIGAIPPKPIEVKNINDILSGRVFGDREKDSFYYKIAAVIRRQCADREYKIKAAKGLAYDALDNILKQSSC